MIGFLLEVRKGQEPLCPPGGSKQIFVLEVQHRGTVEQACEVIKQHPSPAPAVWTDTLDPSHFWTLCKWTVHNGYYNNCHIVWQSLIRMSSVYCGALVWSENQQPQSVFAAFSHPSVRMMNDSGHNVTGKRRWPELQGLPQGEGHREADGSDLGSKEWRI